MDFLKPLAGFEPVSHMYHQPTVLTIKLQELRTYNEL